MVFAKNMRFQAFLRNQVYSALYILKPSFIMHFLFFQIIVFRTVWSSGLKMKLNIELKYSKAMGFFL